VTRLFLCLIFYCFATRRWLYLPAGLVVMEQARCNVG